MKEIVYENPPNDVADLTQKIINAFANIDANVFQRIRRNILGRAQACIAAEGGHFEYFDV